MFETGQIIDGKYRLIRLLGEGGMGAVFEAQHELLGSRVAVKVIHADLVRRPGLADRFMQEGRVAAQIRSPHVVHVADIDRTPEGVAYMVMELLEGEPLAGVLERDHRLPVAIACDYTRQILEGLEAAHAIGVTHRDLKPDNVFVTHAGGRAVLKLIDFGIAKLRRADDTAVKGLTAAGVTMGTAEYMAPEQAYSADQADARSDLFAVGVMFFEMLSGTRPARGDDAREVAMKVARGDVTPLVHAAPDVPRELAGFVHRAMAARPEMRFQSATEMRLALNAIVATIANMATQRHASAPPPANPATQMRPLENPAFAATARADSLPPGEEPAVRTERAPPMGVAGYGYAPPPAGAMGGRGAPYGASSGMRAPERPPARRRKSNAWLYVVIPLVLGGIAGGVYVLVDPMSNDTPAPVTLDPKPSAPATTLTPPTTSLPTATAAAGAVTPMPTLVPSPTVRPPTPSTGTTKAPVPTATVPGLPTALPTDAAAPGPTQPGFPPGFPTTFPTSFPIPGMPGSTHADGGAAPPFTMPSGFPTSFPIPFPTALPTPTTGPIN